MKPPFFLIKTPTLAADIFEVRSAPTFELLTKLVDTTQEKAELIVNALNVAATVTPILFS